MGVVSLLKASFQLSVEQTIHVLLGPFIDIELCICANVKKIVIVFEIRFLCLASLKKFMKQNKTDT